MEEYSQEIIDNIKHEPEVHFTCYLPEDPESEDEPEMKEVKIVLRKFDKKWKSPAELFGSYFVCGFCDQQFNCNNCKSNHISRVHRKDSNWLCTECDYKTSRQDCLKQHYQIHVKKFSCSTCSQNFSFIHFLRNHQQQHRHGIYGTKAEIKFECANCIHSFATKNGLRKHEKYVHSKIRFRCDFCGKTSKTKLHLRLHMQFHFKVPCPICRHLLAERRLQSHIEKHTTTASFKCEAKVTYMGTI